MDPPHFRKASSEVSSCGACDHFSNVGFCGKYQRPMLSYELCDGFASVFMKGKKQEATP
jgi:hypothetical protein